jgi:hypothetical protein
LNNVTRNTLVLFLFIILAGASFAQSSHDTSRVNRKILGGVIAFESVAAVTSIAGLSVLWYADYPHSSFHFFNDNSEWLQMDKIGHTTSSYNIGKTGYELLRLSGVEKKKALWYGGTTGFFYLAAIEIMDGFSAEWGASPGDVAANALGTAAFVGQQLAWDEQRVLLKWSYHNSSYARYNPNILGKSLPERMVKDYNGQTYWLSANIRSFLPDASKFPGWLNLALGYSADGMIGAKSNPAEINGKAIPSFTRTRQYLLSLDLDLTRVKTKSKALKMVCNFIGVLKFPFPAVEYNSDRGLVFHGLYF